MPHTLTPEQLDAYGRDGVLFPLSILSPAEISRFRRSFDELLAAWGGNPSPNDMRHLSLFHRWAYDLATLPSVLDVIEDVIGPNILIHSTTMFCKLPASRTYVSWHQDGYYMRPDSGLFTSAWISLGDSHEDNGCMRVVPGSHLHGVLGHAETSRSPDNLLTTGQEVCLAVDDRDAVDVVLEPGQMSLHHIDIVHGSNPNRSDRPRIGYAVRYLAAGVRQKIDHVPVMLVRGEDRFGHYRVQKEPPAMSMAEAIRGQRVLMDWVGRSRSSAVHVPYPPEVEARCQPRP
jgi:non-haem Fe2+, alpha-ketoglutarate-dependent halogenase